MENSKQKDMRHNTVYIADIKSTFIYPMYITEYIIRSCLCVWGRFGKIDSHNNNCEFKLKKNEFVDY